VPDLGPSLIRTEHDDRPTLAGVQDVGPPRKRPLYGDDLHRGDLSD
jgi:hypothetical protein